MTGDLKVDDGHGGGRGVKPGTGWKRVGGAVFDRNDGTRVHVLGMCRLPDGELVNGMTWPESGRLARFVRINGGNRKRGVMAWARTLVNER